MKFVFPKNENKIRNIWTNFGDLFLNLATLIRVLKADVLGGNFFFERNEKLWDDTAVYFVDWSPQSNL